MKTQFDCLKFSWNLWNIVSRRFKKVCDIWTSPTVLPRKQLTWVLIEFSILPKIRIILTELFSKWSHCHDFDYYSLLPAKIIKWMGLFHMYSHNTWIHFKWKILFLVNSKTTQWVINEFWRRVSIIRISTHWVVFEVKR
jgi:hypothetical protein